MQRRQYRRPPLSEVLCSASFETQPWNVATPGLLYERLQADYPSDPQEQQQANFKFSPDSMSMGQVARRYVYANGRGALLIASPDVLSVNQVPEDPSDYEGWESLRARFAQGLVAYREILPGSLSIKRLVVRYINIIAIPKDGPIDLGDYFTIEVPEVNHVDHLRNFLIRTESRLQEPHTYLSLTYASVEDDAAAPADRSLFALDLEVYRDLDTAELSSSDINGELDALHVIENSQFESLITDKTRGLFA